MPMAGNGSRFSNAGYETPKPLIDIGGKPMFVRAIESIGLDFDDYIFIVREEHNMKNSVLEHYPNEKVIELDTLTEGAACSVAKADLYLDDNDSVCICNCDQLFVWNSTEFKNHKNNAGMILLFHEPTKNPKWSFAEYDSNTTQISRVAEKNPISEYATAGLYYWHNWGIYKQSLQMMIDANDRTNGEFYLCPVYNYTLSIKDQFVSGIVSQDLIGLGTPEDLQKWLDS
jgi:NDP-sugar pyrophosphorylase family protein